MAMSPATYDTFINGLYEVMYGRTADSVGFNWARGQVGLASNTVAASTSATASQAQALAGVFQSTQSTYFASTYGALTASQFVNALYVNLGGNVSGVSGSDMAYWQGMLNSLGGNRAALAGEFTLEFLNYAGTDAAGLGRQSALLNKVAVSQAWVSNSAANSFMNAAAITDAAFKAETAVLQGVDGTTATLAVALAQVNGAASIGNLSGVVGQVAPVSAQTFSLTTGVDNAGVGAFSAANPNTNATIYGTIGTGATFTPGDSIIASSGATGVTINISDAGTAGTANVTGIPVTVAGVQTLTVSSVEALTVNTKSGLGGYAGLTQINVTSQSQGVASASSQSDTITAASSTNVTVNDAAYNNGAGTGTGGVTVSGGNNVSVIETGATTTASTITVGGATNNPVGSETVLVSGKGNTIINVDGGSSAAVTTSQSGAVGIGVNVASTGAVTETTATATGDAAGNVTIGGGASATVSVTSYTAGTVGISNVTGANNVTLSSTSVGATSAVAINGGTTATVSTTGGNVTIGATTLPTGAISVTNTNTRGAGAGAINADAIVVDGKSAIASGPVSITTTATSGNIRVGDQGPTANKGVAGNVTVVDATVNGANTYYGSATTTVYTAGATSVAITGGGTGGTVADQLTTNVLSTVSLTGVGGTIGVSSTALTNLNVSRSGYSDQLGNAQTVSTVNVTSVADGTLNVGLSATKVATAIYANNAKVINVVGSGSDAMSLKISQTLTPAATGKTLNITNNASAALTLTGLDDTNVGTGYTITTGGTGNIALGNLSSATYAGAASILTGTQAKTITSGNSGTLSVTVDGTATTFNGGSSVNTVTLVGAGGGLTKVINGGTSGNNTLVVGEAFANYSAGPGLGISNFQNLNLGAGATGAYALTAFTGLATNNQSTAAVSFTGAASGQGLSITKGAVGTSAVTVTTSTGAGTGTVTINGQPVSFAVDGTTAATTGASMAAAINAAGIVGVSAAAVGAVVTISGMGVGGNVTTGTGTATFTTGAGTGATKALDASSETITWGLATATGTNSLPVSIGAAANSGGEVQALNESNIASLAVTSLQEKGKVTNTLTILDTTTTVQANGATAITVAGNGATNLNYNINVATGTNTLATLDGSASSGSLNVTGVEFRAAGEAITGGSGALTAFGSGVLLNNAGLGFYNSVDTVTTGSGGGTVTLGYGGANAGTGSMTVNLGNSAAKTDTIVVASAATIGVRATVNAFTTGASNGDVLRFVTNAQTNTSGQFSFGTAQGQTLLTTSAVAASTAGFGGADTYTIQNGMILFAGGDSYTVKLASARAIVNAAGTNSVGAFTFNGNTIVVGSGGSNAVGADDVVVTLAGVSATEIGSATGSLNSIAFDAATVTASTYTGVTKATTVGASAATVDNTGYMVATIDNGTATGAVTLSNLAQAAIVTDAHTGNYNLTVGQVGASGTNTLTINSTGIHTYPVLTVVGDSALTIVPTAATVVTSLVDTGNTLATLTLGGSSTLSIAGITDTALNTISISDSAAVSLGTSGAPISQAGVTVKFATTTVAPAHAIYMSGAGDTIDATVFTSTLGATPTFSATGAGSTVLGGVGIENIIVGANGTVTMLNTTAAAVGVDAVTGNAQANVIKVGTGSTVTLAIDTATGAALGGSSVINVTGDIAGATSSGAYSFVTVKNITDNATRLQFDTAATTAVTAGEVNVASASSLSQALDLAAYAVNQAGSVASTHYVDYFRFGGDTFVVDHLGTGTAASALTSNDIVVKIVGLANLTFFADAGSGTMTSVLL